MEVHTFTHEVFGTIRAVVEDGNVWYCGVDAARGLEFNHLKDVIKKHTFEDEWMYFPLPDKHNYVQPTKCLKEPCIYRLMLYSKRKYLQRYESWFTNTVVQTMKGFEGK